MLLALLALGNISLHAEPHPEGWRFHGYYVAEGEQWFSLRAPTGEGEWLRKGATGSIRVLRFDPETKALTVQIDGLDHVLFLTRAQTAPSGRSMAHSSEITPSSSPAPAAPATYTPAERFERLRIQALARRVEREEAANRSGLTFASEIGEARSETKTHEPAQNESPQANSHSRNLTTEEWLAIHRRTAERRALLENKWAAEKLAWASGTSPARDSVR